MEEEYFFTCPQCGEEISMLLDTTQASAKYVEDCEVCCNPISVTYTASDGKIDSFDADSLDQ